MDTAALLAVLGVCTLSDLRDRRVPDRALALGCAFALAWVAATDPALLAERLAAGLAAAAFLLCPALAWPGSMGLGDVKLAAMLGLFLGPAVVTALLAAFAAGTAAGLVLFARHGAAARKLTIPFVPYMALGALLTISG